MLQRNREWNRQWQSVVAALSESTYLLTYAGALAAATAGLGTEPGAYTPRVQHRYKPGAGTPLASFCTAGGDELESKSLKRLLHRNKADLSTYWVTQARF